MRRAPVLRLRAEERRQLLLLDADPRVSTRVVRRARIVLQASQGIRNDVIAQRLDTTPATAARWRRRFIQHGLPGITRDAPRPGRPPVIAASKVLSVIRRTLERPAASGGRWSARRLAHEVGLSRSTIQRIWKARGIDPRQSVQPSGSTSRADFFDRVTDMVGLFVDPPERAIAFSTNERARGSRLPPGQRRLLSELRERHRGAEFQAFLQAIDRETPGMLDVHLLVDSRLAPPSPEVEHWLVRHPRFHLHYLPQDAVGSSAIDRLFAEFSKKRVRPEATPPVWQLHRAIRAHFRAANERSRPFVWTASRDAIRGPFGGPVIQYEINGTPVVPEPGRRPSR